MVNVNIKARIQYYIDGNEYYNNIKYALDPHSGTHDVTITNNWVHDNPLGIIVQIKYSSRLSTHSRKTDKTFRKHFNQH
ncbi:MAG: hypothetical protein ACJ70W_03010 [Nitrososphaera sp.]